MRILVADDEPVLANTLVDYLEGCGHEVTAVTEGPPVVSLIEAGESFDVLLTDLQMPDLGGQEIRERVRALGWDRPIIFMTGHVDRDTIDVGDAHLLLKPFRLHDLSDLLDRLAESPA